MTATEQLLDLLGVPSSIAEMGISKEEFEKAMPDLAKIAFDDPSWRSNPPHATGQRAYRAVPERV